MTVISSTHFCINKISDSLSSAILIHNAVLLPPKHFAHPGVSFILMALPYEVSEPLVRARVHDTLVDKLPEILIVSVLVEAVVEAEVWEPVAVVVTVPQAHGYSNFEILDPTGPRVGVVEEVGVWQLVDCLSALRLVERSLSHNRRAFTGTHGAFQSNLYKDRD